MNDEYHLAVVTEPDEQEVASTLEALMEDIRASKIGGKPYED